LSTRVDEFGNVLDECQYERRLILPRLKLARAHGLTVVPGAYLPRPPSSKGGARRAKPRTRTAS
jgi:hypothetical protein